MALHARGRSFWGSRGDELSQKRVAREIEYDLCVIGLGDRAPNEIKKCGKRRTPVRSVTEEPIAHSSNECLDGQRSRIKEKISPTFAG